MFRKHLPCAYLYRLIKRHARRNQWRKIQALSTIKGSLKNSDEAIIFHFGSMY